MSRLKRAEAWLKQHWQVAAGVALGLVVLLWLTMHKKSGSAGASTISIPSTPGGGNGSPGGGGGGSSSGSAGGVDATGLTTPPPARPVHTPSCR